MLTPEELQAIRERADALIRQGFLDDSYSDTYKRDIPALLAHIEELEAKLAKWEEPRTFQTSSTIKP